MIEVTLSDLKEVSDVKKRIDAYLALFDVSREQIEAHIKGNFVEMVPSTGLRVKEGELIFLNLSWYKIDTSLLFHKFLTVALEADYTRVKPTEQFELRIRPRK